MPEATIPADAANQYLDAIEIAVNSPRRDGRHDHIREVIKRSKMALASLAFVPEQPKPRPWWRIWR